MSNTYEIVGILLLIIGGALLVVGIVMFFGFKIPELVKDLNGTQERKQIEEIRLKNRDKRNKVNVFEDLEKQAKVKKTTGQLRNDATSSMGNHLPPPAGIDEGTSVLQKNKNRVNKNFIIIKDIVFVSSNEVIS